MDKKYIFFFAVILLIFTSILCIAAESPSADTTPTDFNKPILLGAEEKEFSVSLPETPSTGYRWFLVSYDSHKITPIEHTYIAPNHSKLMGSQGNSNWRFQVKDLALHFPIATNIVFEYRRPWEPTSAKQQTVTLLTPGE